MPPHFHSDVHTTDPLIAKALDHERTRQRDQIELIASENIVSRAVLDALGHEMTNKTLEGYPGNRFHGGGHTWMWWNKPPSTARPSCLAAATPTSSRTLDLRPIWRCSSCC